MKRLLGGIWFIAWTLAKLILVLALIRAALYFFGVTSYVPLIDDLWRYALTVGEEIDAVSRGMGIRQPRGF